MTKYNIEEITLRASQASTIGGTVLLVIVLVLADKFSSPTFYLITILSIAHVLLGAYTWGRIKEMRDERQAKEDLQTWLVLLEKEQSEFRE